MADLMTLVGKTYVVKTFGCQMNLHDSERVCGLLDQCGCICVDETDQADIVVFMTCCVRENADQRLYGQASAMVSAPKPPCGRRVVAIGGCIAQRDGEKIRKNIPVADVVFGTSALASLPELLAEAFADDGSVVEVDTGEEDRGFSADLPSRRSQRFHAWVPIMQGCNNFCTYCIVPYVRGREKSRTLEAVVAECEKLVADGVREITLLGQNVNSYGRNIYGEPRFAELLRAVGQTGVERIRFTSSNPKDLSEQTIRAMAEVPAVMPHLHLAVQSGSTRVLRAMNRSYTREEYLDLARRLKEAIPGLALSTDIIVGFPGETEEDFEETLSHVKEAGFSSAFTFIYSPRVGTRAADMPDQIPEAESSRRIQRLIAIQKEITHRRYAAYVGQVHSVLVDEASKRDENQMAGKNEYNITVNFPGSKELIGRIVRVRITSAGESTLRGELVE